MHSIHELLEVAVEHKASDLILKSGSVPVLRVDGNLRKLDLSILTPELTHEFALEVLFSAGRNRLLHCPDGGDTTADSDVFEHKLHQVRLGQELDVAFTIPCAARVRAHLFLERSSVATVLRILPLQPLTLDQLGLSAHYRQIVGQRRGLVIISGQAGMGKTTTVAALVEEINSQRVANIVTLESPVEYIFTDRQSIIYQRELGQDTHTLASGVSSLSHQSPDVVILSELRDAASIHSAMRLANRGCLVLTTLNAGSIEDAVSQIISAFEPGNKIAACHMLADALLCVTSQVLIPRNTAPGRVAATEVLINTHCVAARLREGESCDLSPCIRDSEHLGMNTMDQALEHLYRSDAISHETAVLYADVPAELARLLSRNR